MISVVMSTYTEPIEYVKASVNSILNQTYKDIEFVIMVDAPDNKEMISYLKEVQVQDSRVRVYVNEENLGLTKTLNKAIRLARGQYIARMDADDVSLEDRLETQLKYMQDNGLDIVGCYIRDVDEEGQIIKEVNYYLPTSDVMIKKFLKTYSALAHPTWLVKKEVYEDYIDLGPYVDFPACEDYEFLTRIALDGKRLGNLRTVKLNRRIHDNRISESKNAIQKTSHYYIKNNYISGVKSDLNEFDRFLKSAKGKRLQIKLKKYYGDSSKLRLYFKEGKWIRFFLLGVKVFFTYSEGRTVVVSAIREKYYRKKC